MKFNKQNIPGEELVIRGLQDIESGDVNTVYALLLFLASPRLAELGIHTPTSPEHPNILLYDKLAQEYGDEAHYQYNSLQQRLNKFCNTYIPA